MNTTLENLIDEKELCSTQPVFYLEENLSVITLKSVEVNEATQVAGYWSETTDECKASPTEPNIIIAQYEEEENDMKIEVVSRRQILTLNLFEGMADSVVLEPKETPLNLESGMDDP
ncbi:hypothetical protein Scep_014612 [Stephania cephalantha]|uniref:Uncharacterized protein n=1 Tax=Stephania cephalantha TaxID=152367 RepID=A0AAP0J1I7_9MAGN